MELMLTIVILGITAAIAIPTYRGYVAESRIHVTIHGIRQIELLVVDYASSTGVYPDSLSEVGADQLLDPWGRPFQYLNIANSGNAAKGHQRKDKFLVPVNSDFDLYSLGEDGVSSPPFTAKGSRDDIVRANNGAYIGPAEHY